MSSNKKTIINVVSSLMVLVTNIIIGFWLSPFIVENIGVEANGFVTLANNFVTYANLIVNALNSMAARFITMEYVKKNYKKANAYYNSVFWGNLIIVAVLILPAVYLIVRLENIVDVPENILFDVKLLFSFIFFNFFLGTGLPNWNCGTFVSNRLDRDYIPSMCSSLFRCVFLFSTFTILTPKVYYVGMCASIITVVLIAIKGYNTHILTPELRIHLKKGERICSWQAIKELVGSGIWSTISNVGNMLLSGLDLIICNVFLGATAMGVLAVSKTIPSYMQQLSGSIRDAFVPEITINYAKGNKEAIEKDLDRAMKMTAVIMTIPIAIVIALGEEFFSLWVPSQDAKLLQVLSVLSILGYMFTSGTQILYNVFGAVNRVKENAIAMILSGIVSCGLTLTLIVFTDLDIYAVAGVSTAVNLVRNMTFTLPATAKYLGFKWNKFFRQVAMTCVASVLLIAVFCGIKRLLPFGNWFNFFFAGILMGIIGLWINSMIVLNKQERKALISKVRNKLHI
ncbi:MAG: lipopolysaccharide biosynthesis protein [Lachnospiraceae bacterium]|nr:lipopolysaccharide biosynthesis protein [Lachnospiraceae bacterium]